RAYMEFIVSQPEMQTWITAAKIETEIVDADEAGVDR
ncbi:MAG: glutathione S-transferase, partial [Shewanella sp.]